MAYRKERSYMEFNTDQLIKAYIKIRDAIAEKEKEHKAEIKVLEDQLDVVQQELLAHCEKAGGNISVPGVGRVARRVAKQYWTSDWDSLYQVIKEHDAFYLLHQRISNKAMQQFLEENPDVHPAGLNLDSRYAVTVTRAS
jgi:hypothetical protein